MTFFPPSWFAQSLRPLPHSALPKHSRPKRGRDYGRDSLPTTPVKALRRFHREQECRGPEFGFAPSPSCRSARSFRDEQRMLGGHRAQNMLPCCAPNPFSFPTALLCCVRVCAERRKITIIIIPFLVFLRPVRFVSAPGRIIYEAKAHQGCKASCAWEVWKKIKTRDVPYASSDSRLLLRFCLELCDWENSPLRALTPIAVSRQTHTQTHR